LTLHVPAATSVTSEASAVSPRYNVRLETTALRVTWRGTIAGQRAFTWSLALANRHDAVPAGAGQRQAGG